MEKRYNFLQSNPVRLLLNLLWVYICYEVCRIAFLFENWNLYSGTLSWNLFWKMSAGGWRFDTSAIFYTNAVVILLYLLPWAKKEVRWYHTMTKWIYVIVNSLAVILNLGDSVFFEFRKHRSSMATVQEFQNEGNLGSIFWEEFFAHWYLVLLARTPDFLPLEMLPHPRHSRKTFTPVLSYTDNNSCDYSARHSDGYAR